ncbi:hypothetical protein AAFC00_000356 [Neodothiora populina]|uniref:holo-[acyl-carrier-protein] synthase n=1 Tax=Neodothiora populina TaxID=2781224 RepID=A0ABR3PCL9_9PEZI
MPPSTQELEGFTCWLLDVRALWPGGKIQDAAADVLELLSPEERETCLRKMFIADARMSLGSALLKRLFISRSLGIPWKQVKIARKGDPTHGKPAALSPDGSFAPIDFNVSHQAGLVALVGCRTGQAREQTTDGLTQVGVDIVCVNERDDYRTIDQEGFDGWIDIYEEVFSEEERWDMKFKIDSLTLLDGRTLTGEQIGRNDRCVHRHRDLTVRLPSGQTETFTSDILIDAKLRRFYTFFCYKEAYIKLAGEALLAPWLKQLEFHNVKSPEPGTVARCSTHGVWGEKVDDVEVSLHGKTVSDVRMSIQAFEESFMIATAVRGPSLSQLPSFTGLHLEHDILPYTTKEYAL